MSKPISDKEFFGFSWPPRMAPKKPKMQKHYKHNVLIGSTKDKDLDLEISFKSEKKAREAIAILRQSVNNLDVGYEKEELPRITEEGIML